MRSLFFLSISMLIINCNSPVVDQNTFNPDVFRFNEKVQTRWSSFENLNGIKGAEGQENNGAKGHAYDQLPAGSELTLLDVNGPGMINRMWFTLRERSPYELRGLVLQFFWDQNETPAISVPFGDFFGIGLSQDLAFENALFASPEGRSFNSYLQMPFRSGARVVIKNEMTKDVDMLFFDINYQILDHWEEDFMYLHAYWHRDTATTMTKDFEILPLVEGRGRFLGTSISVQVNPIYEENWWGEGEVKMYLEDDSSYPTLVGTGTEDYIGTGWGQGQYIGRYQGCTRADSENKMYSFYRFHIPDPVYFHSKCRITIQQMGGDQKKKMQDLQAAGIPLIPVEVIGNKAKLHPLYEPGQTADLSDESIPGEPNSWVNYYRSDDVSAIAFFYLDQPGNNLGKLQPVSVRNYKL